MHDIGEQRLHPWPASILAEEHASRVSAIFAPQASRRPNVGLRDGAQQKGIRRPQVGSWSCCEPEEASTLSSQGNGDQSSYSNSGDRSGRWDRTCISQLQQHSRWSFQHGDGVVYEATARCRLLSTVHGAVHGRDLADWRRFHAWSA